MIDTKKLGNGKAAPDNVYPVVVPDNMGKGLAWNNSSAKYDIALGDGLQFDDAGRLIMLKPVNTNVTVAKFDNGSAVITGETYTIDYGNGLIEVSGSITLPLLTSIDNQPVRDMGAQPQWAGHSVDDRTFINCSLISQEYYGQKLYHKESITKIKASDLGMTKILGVSAIVGDLPGLRTEAAWARDWRIGGSELNLGVRTLAELKQDSIVVMFQIKGIKA